MTDYMVTGLVKKRAELAGELESTHSRLRELVDWRTWTRPFASWRRIWW